ncbi:MAG TPA: hypothetical protein VGF75_07520 [Candidatus Saccharimonadales bacterium]|jgi:hypothetical protein
MQKLLNDLKETFPKLRFHEADRFYWSPHTKEIFYNQKAKGRVDEWSLLHEVGHALLEHSHYDADFMLVRLEIEAWQKAKDIAGIFGMSIDENHIQDCLDTYRDWLYKRSICPNCSNKSFQQSDFSHYRCFNCHKQWRVTTSRFCRTYRMSDDTVVNQPVFI